MSEVGHRTLPGLRTSVVGAGVAATGAAVVAHALRNWLRHVWSEASAERSP
jgi:hypothetical protein